MNSSPPPPSFTLPPLNSSGKFLLTPSPTPSPDGTDKEFQLGDASRAGPSPSRKAKGKAAEVHVKEEEGRISMYVKLFDEMISTALESESYLFTPREIWILRHILALPYEPHYLLTRLLLRRPCKIHPYSSLVNAYSAELGEEGVKRAMRSLSRLLPIPQDIIDSEPTYKPIVAYSSKLPLTPLAPTKSYPTPSSSKVKGKQRSDSSSNLKPWSTLPTGLTPDEEKADPDLAEALRESLWAAKVGRVELDEDGQRVETPPPEAPARARSVSGGSTTSTSSRSTNSAIKTVFDEDFSLLPRPPPPINALGRDERELSLDDLMSCIMADDLRKVARARKIPLSALANRESTMAALRGMAKRQTVLSFTSVKGKGKATDNGKGGQMTLPFSPGPKLTSESLLVHQLLPYLGHAAVQLTSELHALIARVNLIFSRTPPLTSGGASLMLPSILVTSHKRRYPEYGSPTRSRIWNDREELLKWERAVGWEALVSDALGETWVEQRKNPLPGFGAGKPMLSRTEGAKVVRRVWEGVWTVWKDMVEGEKGQAVDSAKEDGGLVGDRFQTGHVLTRIVFKGATALGILHEYDNECMVLKDLLAQRRWRRSRRGAWYDRLALVLMNHYNASPEEKEDRMREATQVCIDGLLDEDTHLIYRPALSRRLTRLENKLNLPADERHISYASLNKCEIRELPAPRVAENMGQPRFRARSDSVRGEREASLGMGDEEMLRGSMQQVGKSVWVGREGEVTVEGWVLEWWEKKGYKGFHSESSILTTLFTLLMWPILFHPLPGAFETPYQTAPLDLGEDTFAPSRLELIEARLEAMNNTNIAIEMLRETDARERPRGTWAVGVNWEYGAEELEELLECLGGTGLSGVCRMLAEEYRHRVSGVPDLIVWNYETKDARFVEVKGPGDSLSETQKVWIDVLLSAGIKVEVCKVKARDPTSKQLEKVEKKRKSSASLVSLTDKKGKGNDGRKVYARNGDGEWMDDGEGDIGGKDEEDEGWEKEDEMEYESGDEGKGGGKLIRK
ncbi:hypothetical protein IAR55_001319 [Kwoniella newhampshirensis]|uniref:Fanconi-associated nuclease n=1 Tax=Kwoniella newhampshirensis TaxID=1651941 RepID=A0AAW0Z5Q0_9TREE